MAPLHRWYHFAVVVVYIVVMTAAAAALELHDLPTIGQPLPGLSALQRLIFSCDGPDFHVAESARRSGRARDFQVIGLIDSGTNWVRSLIEANCGRDGMAHPPRLSGYYGNKHRLEQRSKIGRDAPNPPRPLLIVAVARDPLAWMRSVVDNPYSIERNASAARRVRRGARPGGGNAAAPPSLRARPRLVGGRSGSTAPSAGALVKVPMRFWVSDSYAYVGTLPAWYRVYWRELLARAALGDASRRAALNDSTLTVARRPALDVIVVRYEDALACTEKLVRGALCPRTGTVAAHMLDTVPAPAKWPPLETLATVLQQRAHGYGLSYREKHLLYGGDTEERTRGFTHAELAEVERSVGAGLLSALNYSGFA